MLHTADVCPACGEEHTDRQYAFLHRGTGQCPALMESNFSIVSRPSAPIEAHLVPDVPKKVAPEVPISMGSLPLPPREVDSDRRTRTLAMPWLPPPEVGGVF